LTKAKYEYDDGGSVTDVVGRLTVATPDVGVHSVEDSQNSEPPTDPVDDDGLSFVGCEVDRNAGGLEDAAGGWR
jgi:hypothetical protein